MSVYAKIEKDNLVMAQHALTKAIKELEKVDADTEKTKNLVNVARKALFFNELVEEKEQ